jgi:hypothetical protein
MTIFRTIDDLLRGKHTAGRMVSESGIQIEASVLMSAVAVLGVAYGMFMGLYAALRGGAGAVLQVLAAMGKVPLLFLLTLLVTFPSLYVFAALARSRLSFGTTLRLLLAAMTVGMALLASFGPVTGFFTLSTESYPFMVVLNVVFFTIAGAVGLSFLRKTLSGVFDDPAAPPSPSAALGARALNAEKSVFGIWSVIYAVVCAQMGWILRPFIGDPNRPFTLFRERQGNFFFAVIEAFSNLFQ